MAECVTCRRTCVLCRMAIPEAYYKLGAVADREIWKRGELQRIELAHNDCARHDKNWRLGRAG